MCAMARAGGSSLLYSRGNHAIMFVLMHYTRLHYTVLSGTMVPDGTRFYLRKYQKINPNRGQT